MDKKITGVMEPTLVRCARCGALVALQDASRCKYHQTEPLCTFCWKDHVERNRRSQGGLGQPYADCWVEVGMLDWR